MVCEFMSFTVRNAKNCLDIRHMDVTKNMRLKRVCTVMRSIT